MRVLWSLDHSLNFAVRLKIFYDIKLRKDPFYANVHTNICIYQNAHSHYLSVVTIWVIFNSLLYAYICYPHHAVLVPFRNETFVFLKGHCWLPETALPMLWDKSLCFFSCILVGRPLSQQTLLFNRPPPTASASSLCPRGNGTPSPPPHPSSAARCLRLSLCCPQSLCDPRAPISTPTPPRPGTLPGALLGLIFRVCKIGKILVPHSRCCCGDKNEFTSSIQHSAWNVTKAT